MVIPSEAIICSICAQTIPDYVPEYFCGEELHPACKSCKENEFSSLDPFSSFLTSAQPPSLVSHWLLPQKSSLPRSPSSITSLLSHIVQFPNPGKSIFLIEEAVEIMRAKMDIHHAEMKNWLDKRLEEIMAPVSKLGD